MFLHESCLDVICDKSRLWPAWECAAGWSQLLNAKPENVERESETVAQSGRSGTVTIATNMAGRGTDIILGGNPEFMARLKLREMLMPRVVSQIEGENVLSRSSTTKVWLLAIDLPHSLGLLARHNTSKRLLPYYRVRRETASMPR